MHRVGRYVPQESAAQTEAALQCGVMGSLDQDV